MKKDLRMINTDSYEYTNVNPKDKHGGDCVVRAVALACGQDWVTTVREMTELGIKLGFVLNDKHTYIKYLLNKGFMQCKEPRDINNRKMTVKEWLKREGICESNQKCTIVANVGSHHVTCIVNGKVHDIWDSSRQTMHAYWLKK